MSSKDRIKDLDELEYIILNEENIKIYGLDPKNLYSFDKKTDDDKEIYSQIIKVDKASSIDIRSTNTIINGGASIGIEYLTTYSIRPNEEEIRKNTNFIRKYSPLCVHIPFMFTGDKYYIEYSAKERTSTRSEKIIISISLDREHKNELIHISFFPHSFIHLTFIINGKHYKIYQISNPDWKKRFNDILLFTINCLNLFKTKNITLKKNLWCNHETNNWKYNIINNNPIFESLEFLIMLILQSIEYLITRKFFIDKFFN